MSDTGGIPQSKGPQAGAAGRFVTMRDQSLSLWQAAAEQAVRQAGAANEARANLLAHPVLRSVAAHVAAQQTGHGLGNLVHHVEAGAEHEVLAHLSKHFLEQAQAAVVEGGPWERLEARIRNAGKRFEANLLAKLGARRFGNLDPLWTACAMIYAQYWVESGGKVLYRDWKTDGHADPDYGVISYRLPADARVALLGDWGTGMDDAEGLLRQIMQEHKPTAVIHLGDVYYAGTRDECQFNFIDIFERAFKDFGRVPVYTIPGNHDYYAFGLGFYDLIDRMNAAGDPSWRQEASYFCLRTADDAWQFLGMDTGQDDGNPLHKKGAPLLRDSEVEWLCDKIDRFPNRTVLLSHHQVFSSHSTVDAGAPKPYLNQHLLDAFRGRLDRVAAWFWGHEHNLALYEDGLMDVRKGRLVGSSAFELELDEDPNTVKYPEVPFHLFEGGRVQAAKSGEFFNHTYAIIDLHGPSEAAAVEYYQIPSWGGRTQVLLPPDQKSLLATETLGGSSAGPQGDQDRQGRGR